MYMYKGEEWDIRFDCTADNLLATAGEKLMAVADADADDRILADRVRSRIPGLLSRNFDFVLGFCCRCGTDFAAAMQLDFP